jgi:hypothetical protein
MEESKIPQGQVTTRHLRATSRNDQISLDLIQQRLSLLDEASGESSTADGHSQS